MQDNVRRTVQCCCYNVCILTLLLSDLKAGLCTWVGATMLVNASVRLVVFRAHLHTQLTTRLEQLCSSIVYFLFDLSRLQYINTRQYVIPHREHLLGMVLIDAFCSHILA